MSRGLGFVPRLCVSRLLTIWILCLRRCSFFVISIRWVVTPDRGIEHRTSVTRARRSTNWVRCGSIQTWVGNWSLMHRYLNVNHLRRIVNKLHERKKEILGPDVGPICKFYHISVWLHCNLSKLEPGRPLSHSHSHSHRGIKSYDGLAPLLFVLSGQISYACSCADPQSALRKCCPPERDSNLRPSW